MSEECQRTQDKMADYIYGALSRQDSDALNEHVAGCSKCTEHLQELTDQSNLLRDFAGKVDAGMQQRKERMADAIKRCNPVGRRKLPLIWPAVAAGLLIAVGFLAGQLLPDRPVNLEEVQVALETSLKSSVERAVQQNLAEQVSRDRELALERFYVRLREELTGQFRQEVNKFAVQTLAESRAETEQRLAYLIQLIEAARTVDHWQVAKALEQIESSRLQDRTRFGEQLVSFVALKNEVPPNSQ